MIKLYLPEFGQFALILALLFSVTQVSIGFFSFFYKKIKLLNLTYPLHLTQIICVIIAYLLLLSCFLLNDFSVIYIVRNSLIELPLIYKFTAVWGGHEGSLLLWITLLNIWSLVFIIFSKKQFPEIYFNQVLIILALINIGFLLFIILTSNPFSRDLINMPLNGYDLNPLLQDPGMVSHPPMLYMGYVGFGLVFALAIAFLLNIKNSNKVFYVLRIWTLLAWSFLTLGITLGSFWAYYVLGWGGWWYWDPVENASFMPWLTGTALIHMLIMADKRSLYRGFSILLIIITFALSLIGTFIVRSGVITSVHAFASDPSRGAFILLFLCVVIGASLSLYIMRSHLLANTRENMKFALLSRESFLFVGNLILLVLAMTVFLGTVYPMILDIFNIAKISVGAPYFNSVFVPLFYPLALLVGLGALTKWKAMHDKKLWMGILKYGIVAIILTIISLFLSSKLLYLQYIIAIFLGLWIITLCIYKLRLKLALGVPSGGFWGVILSHFSIGIIMLSIVLSNSLSIGQDIKLAPDQILTLGNYQFKFTGVANIAGDNYNGIQANFDVYKNKHFLFSMTPEKRFYLSPEIWQGNTAINNYFIDDLYIAMGDQYPDGSWTFRIYIKPFVRFMWFAGLLIGIAGIIGSVAKIRKKIW